MKKPDRRKKTKTPPPKREAKTKRLTRHAIARQMRIQHSLVNHYMALEGAPVPDKRLRYDPREAIEWIKAKSKWAVAGTSEKTRSLKDEKLELEVAAMRRAEAVARGELVSKSEVVETLEALIVEIEGLYRTKFEHELPPKYQGKNEAERRELNKQGLAEAAAAFRAGKLRVEKQVSQPPAA